MSTTVSLLVLSLAAGGYQRLYADRATASSYLENNWNKFTENYHPSYALDGDPSTAWVEGAGADGVGESLEVRTSPLATAKSVKLRIRNGYQKSKPLLKKNAAPKRLRIDLLRPTGAVAATKTVTLARRTGWQDVVVPVPERTGFAGVRLTIESVHRGSVYRDTCISDLEIWAESEIAYNERAENAKHAALLAWVEDRKKDADYFKKLPKAYPFGATHFDRAEVVRARSSHEEEGFVRLAEQWRKGALEPGIEKVFSKKDLQAFRELEAFGKKNGDGLGRTPYTAVAKDRPRLPDGLDVANPDLFQKYLDLSNVSFFEAKAQSKDVLGDVELVGIRELYKKYVRAHPRIEWADAAKKTPKRIYVWDDYVVEERGVYEFRQDYLFVFDGGRLVEMYTLAFGTESFSLDKLEVTWRDDKVVAVERRRASGWSEFDEFAGNDFSHVRITARVAVAKN